jgi:hypothetical protein
MITFRVSTEVKDDRQVVLQLPPEVPTGQAELVVTVDSPTPLLPEQEEWQRFGTRQLARAYGPNEPEYTEADLKPELNS